MPKRTKKQKILAELRRKLMAVSTTPPQPEKKQDELVKKQSEFVKKQNSPTQSTISASSASTFIYTKESVLKPKMTLLSSSYTYVIHDLIKITIFTLFAFVFQVMLYFLLRRN